MSVRFTKRKKVAPGTSATVSKGGASLSTGVRGARVSAGRRGLRSSFGIPGTGLSFSGPRSGGAFGVLIGLTVMTMFWSIKLIVKSVLAVIPLLLQLFVVTGKAIFTLSSWAVNATRRAVNNQQKAARATDQQNPTKSTKPKQATKAKE